MGTLIYTGPVFRGQVGSAVVEISAEKKVIVRKLHGVGGSLSATLVLRDGHLWIPRENGIDVVSLATGDFDKEIPLKEPLEIVFP